MKKDEQNSAHLHRLFLDGSVFGKLITLAIIH